MTLTPDVIVVGAGPGGSIAAETMAEAGLNVLLIDKLPMDSRQEKPCGGGIPNQVLIDFDIKPENVVEKRIKGSIIIASDGNQYTLEAKGKDYGWNMRRAVFDKFLTDRAVSAGANLLDRTRVVDLIIKNGKVSGVVCKNDKGVLEYEAPLTIAADGVGSQTVIKAGLRNKWNVERDIGQCAVAFVEGYNPSNDDENEYYNRFYLSNQIAPNAYAWIFPLNDHVANIGLGLHRTKGLNPMHYLLKFIEWEGIADKFSKPKVIWKRNHPVPLCGIKGKTVGDGIIAIGDSVGFVSPMLGEGIIYAMWTGKLAGKTAIEARESNDYSKDNFKKYKRAYKKMRFPNIFSTHRALRDLLMSDVDYNVSQIIKLAKTDEDAQAIIENALTGESRDISPELMTRALLLIEKALKKDK